MTFVSRNARASTTRNAGNDSEPPFEYYESISPRRTRQEYQFATMPSNWFDPNGFGSGGSPRRHAGTTGRGGSSQCERCEDHVAAFSCTECSMRLCANCNRLVHETGRMRYHTASKLSEEPSVGIAEQTPQSPQGGFKQTGSGGMQRGTFRSTASDYRTPISDPRRLASPPRAAPAPIASPRGSHTSALPPGSSRPAAEIFTDLRSSFKGNSSPRGQDLAGLCENCESVAVATACKECRMQFCAPCSRLLHSDGPLSGHTLKSLHATAEDSPRSTKPKLDPSIACSRCAEEAKWQCTDCRSRYCTACSSIVHADRVQHTISRMPKTIHTLHPELLPAGWPQELCSISTLAPASPRPAANAISSPRGADQQRNNVSPQREGSATASPRIHASPARTAPGAGGSPGSLGQGLVLRSPRALRNAWDTADDDDEFGQIDTRHPPPRQSLSPRGAPQSSPRFATSPTRPRTDMDSFRSSQPVSPRGSSTASFGSKLGSSPAATYGGSPQQQFNTALRGLSPGRLASSPQGVTSPRLSQLQRSPRRGWDDEDDDDGQPVGPKCDRCDIRPRRHWCGRCQTHFCEACNQLVHVGKMSGHNVQRVA
eukprot:TRINITY_DN12416_c0_g1_i1.p1 TRINITY_DN12416_c0_g1~~TRINITY_DN12416_c0_g1_i1.p1  ORF type:complete len:605 (+),score=49.13 TRINITY_DN12416_c0_g1_i1:22-1815(+)